MSGTSGRTRSRFQTEPEPRVERHGHEPADRPSPAEPPGPRPGPRPARARRIPRRSRRTAASMSRPASSWNARKRSWLTAYGTLSGGWMPAHMGQRPDAPSRPQACSLSWASQGNGIPSSGSWFPWESKKMVEVGPAAAGLELREPGAFSLLRESVVVAPSPGPGRRDRRDGDNCSPSPPSRRELTSTSIPSARERPELLPLAVERFEPGDDPEGRDWTARGRRRGGSVETGDVGRGRAGRSPRRPSIRGRGRGRRCGRRRATWCARSPSRCRSTRRS